MEENFTITIKEAAKLMHTSEQFVRIGLRNERLPFGTAVKMSTKWTYYISPKLFYDFIGFNPILTGNEVTYE